jgi:hypothetical protein
LEAILKVHISGESVHRPGDCQVGTKGTITATDDSTARGKNGLQADR